jgi:hypothetical protein
MLLPKLAKERELDPCKHWVVPVLDSHKEKLEDSEKHKRRFFRYGGRTNFWDFVGLNYSLVKFLVCANPLTQDTVLCSLVNWLQQKFLQKYLHYPYIFVA